MPGERVFKPGDYVLATKYHDGDTGDEYAVGYYKEPFEKFGLLRHMVRWDELPPQMQDKLRAEAGASLRALISYLAENGWKLVGPSLVTEMYRAAGNELSATKHFGSTAARLDHVWRALLSSSPSFSEETSDDPA